MKTKQVPITITLIAGFVTCVIGFLTHMEMARFVRVWVTVLIVFYILGCFAKLALDRVFKEEAEEAADEGEEEQAEDAEPSEDVAMEAEPAEEAVDVEEA